MKYRFAPNNWNRFVNFHSVYMKDVSKQTMESLMSFMYKGEVDVKRDLLLDFMNTAQALKIKGLADDRFSFKSGNQQQQQPTQSVQHEAVHGAIQYQSSNVNRNNSAAMTHQNQPATIHEQRSMNENHLTAVKMSSDLGTNPYAMKKLNNGDRGYGLDKDYESDDDQANGNGNAKYKNGSSNGQQVFANGPNNDISNAKRPNLEPNGM